MSETENTPDELAIEDGTQALASVYLLLSYLWMQELDQDLINLLNTPDVAELIANLGGSVPPKDDPAVVENLAEDFCQLFIGPQNHHPPIQSWWTHGQLQSEDSDSCRAFYSLLDGFEPPINMPDHLGNQLLFVSALLDRNPDDPDFDACLDLADQFFERHLSWTSPLFAKAMDQAKTDFYKGLIQITNEFLNEDPE